MIMIQESRLFKIQPQFIAPILAILQLGSAVSNSLTIQALGFDFDHRLIVRVFGGGTRYDRAVELLTTLENGKVYLPPFKNKKSKHIGKRGEQVSLDADIYDMGLYMHPIYGLQYIYRISSKGNEFTWRTTKQIELGRYKLTGKIKDYYHSQGVAYTVLSYCRLTAKVVRKNAKHKHKRSSTDTTH